MDIQTTVGLPTSKDEIFTILRQHDEAIRLFGVKRYGLFGSFVRNESHAESDVDILVEFAPDKKTFDNFIGLACYLEDILGRRVDLITKEALSPYLGPYILQEVEYVTFNTCISSTYA